MHDALNPVCLGVRRCPGRQQLPPARCAWAKSGRGHSAERLPDARGDGRPLLGPRSRNIPVKVQQRVLLHAHRALPHRERIDVRAHPRLVLLRVLPHGSARLGNSMHACRRRYTRTSAPCLPSRPATGVVTGQPDQAMACMRERVDVRTHARLVLLCVLPHALSHVSQIRRQQACRRRPRASCAPAGLVTAQLSRSVQQKSRTVSQPFVRSAPVDLRPTPRPMHSQPRPRGLCAAHALCHLMSCHMCDDYLV